MQLTAPGPAPATDVSVSATTADEMAEAQSALIRWAQAKVADIRSERDEANECYERAVRSKWKSDPLKRMAERAEKRLTFYEKILAALQAGYTIIPNFPVTAFAIRTDRSRPLAMLTTSWGSKHTQRPAGLPAGEGEYLNPFPLVYERIVKQRTATTAEEKEYWASSWKDLEFPISMAKPEIMEATTRTMALKVFDDLGVLPAFAPGEGTRPPRGDPMIVARIWDYSQSLGYRPESDRRHVTFMVAWRVNTRDL